MTPDILVRVGTTLHGRRWQSKLAHDLGVSDRTLRRWLSDSHRIPDGVRDVLIWILQDRTHDLHDLIVELKKSNSC